MLLTEFFQQESSSASAGTPRDDSHLATHSQQGAEFYLPFEFLGGGGSGLFKDPPALVTNSWNSKVFAKMEGGAGGAELSPSDPSHPPDYPSCVRLPVTAFRGEHSKTCVMAHLVQHFLTLLFACLFMFQTLKHTVPS